MRRGEAVHQLTDEYSTLLHICQYYIILYLRIDSFARIGKFTNIHHNDTVLVLN